MEPTGQLIKGLISLIEDLNTIDEEELKELNERGYVGKYRKDKTTSYSFNDYVSGRKRLYTPIRIRRRRHSGRLSWLAGTINSIRCRIWPNDHPPPHFHAIFNDGEFNARINIDEGTYMGVTKNSRREPTPKEIKKIEKWAKAQRDELMGHWDRLRPTDFEVGYAQPRSGLYLKDKREDT